MDSERDRFRDALLRAGVGPEAAERRVTLIYGEAPPARDPRVLEKDEQRAIRRLFIAFGFRVYWLSQPRESKQTPGLADLWCVHTREPIAFWWESKRQVGGALSPAQVEFADDCRRCLVGYGTGDRHAAEVYLIALGLAERRTPGGPLEPKRRPTDPMTTI